jgi:hypothetical protein
MGTFVQEMEVIVVALEELTMRRIYKMSLSHTKQNNKIVIHSKHRCSSDSGFGEVRGRTSTETFCALDLWPPDVVPSVF